jgi:transcriptional regulator with XRE-family HTH domain
MRRANVPDGARAFRRSVPHRHLQELRLNEGLSPNDLAYRAGVSGNAIRAAEAGFLPTPRVQFAIARVFGLTPLALWPIDRQRVAR